MLARADARCGRVAESHGTTAQAVTGPKDFGRPDACRHAYWARDGTDFRPSMNGVGGAFASRRTVCKSSREPWHDGAGCYRTLGFRPPRSLHAYLCGRDGTDLRPSINGGVTVPVAAHSLQACRRAIAHRHRRFIDLRDSVNSHFNLHPLHALTKCNSHLCTLMTSQTVRDSSKDCFYGQFGRLTREYRARATRRVHTSTRSGTSTSCNESRPLALRDDETAAAVTRDTAQQMIAGAI